MKIVVITSRLTFVPGNYIEPIESILSLQGDHEVSFLIVDNIDFKLILKSIFLYFIGARNFSKTMLKNIWSSLVFRKKKILLGKNKVQNKFVKKVNDQETLDWLEGSNPDFIFNMRSRCIFKKAFLDKAKVGSYNIHHGILPKDRGLMADLYAIYREEKVGFSIHEMTTKVDDGLLYDVNIRDFPVDKNYISYLGRSAKIEAKVIKKFLENLLKFKGNLPSRENKGSQYIYTTNPSVEEIRKMIKSGVVL